MKCCHAYCRTHLQQETRQATCLTVAKCLTGRSQRHLDSLLLMPWLARHKDNIPEIRKLVARYIPTLLLHQQQQACMQTTDVVMDRLIDISETLLTDPQRAVRTTALHSMCNDCLYQNTALQQNHHTAVNRICHILLDIDLPRSEKRDILGGLVRVWSRAAWGSLPSIFTSSRSSNRGEDRGSDTNDKLFASLLAKKLKPGATPANATGKNSNDATETCFVDWLVPRLFQTATTYHRPNLQYRQHRTSHPSKERQGRSAMGVLESALEQGWQKYVVGQKNQNNKHSCQQQVASAAAIVLWHRLPYQVGVAWGQPRARRQKTLYEYLDARREAQEAPKGKCVRFPCPMRRSVLSVIHDRACYFG